MQLRLIFILLVVSIWSQAQIIPENGPIFDDLYIPRIDVYIAPDDLIELLATGNEFSNTEYPVSIAFQNGGVPDTIHDVGMRLRGNTSRLAEKKSFKFSFNTFVPGRKYHGLEKLNINGSHNDPTNARVKVALDAAQELGLSAPRAVHLELVINGSYYGLYTHVEHIDENFVDVRYGHNVGNLYKCLWPSQLNYLGSNPESYKFMQGDRRAYELKNNNYLDDYSDLAHFIGILNNTPISDLPCTLEPVFNVDGYLKAIAYEILIGHWDNYMLNKNNFYLYHNLSTNQFEYIVFDVDNTLGINWVVDNYDFTNRNIYSWSNNNEPRPMYQRILEVPKYKDRLSYYFDQFMAGVLNPDTLAANALQWRTIIEPYMQTDPFYPLDYGFNMTDFNDSFDESVGYWFIPDGINSFVEARNSSALQQLELNPIPPVITMVNSNHPLYGEPIWFTAKVWDDGLVDEVKLYYQTDGATLNNTLMFDDGLHQDGAANDGLYGVELPSVTENTVIEYYIEAIDNDATSSHSPICDFRRLYIGSSNLPLKINELMPANNSTIDDEAGEYDDWIELHNYGSQDIDLGGKHLTDNLDIPYKWKFPDLCIKAGGYLLIWADNDDDQGINHCTFKLSASGETIALIDSEENNFALIDRVDYPEQADDESYARLPNGTGPWQDLDPSPGYSNDPNGVFDKFISGVTIQPNPGGDYFQLQFDSFIDLTHISIVDVHGREVYSKAINGSALSSYTFYTNEWASGVYFIRGLVDDEQVALGKFLRI